jgi:hypothetical protein
MCVCVYVCMCVCVYVCMCVCVYVCMCVLSFRHISTDRLQCEDEWPTTKGVPKDRRHPSR